MKIADILKQPFFFSVWEWLQVFKFFCEAKIMKRDVRNTSIHRYFQIKCISWPETGENLHYFLNVYRAFLQLACWKANIPSNRELGQIYYSLLSCLSNRLNIPPVSTSSWPHSWTHSLAQGVFLDLKQKTLHKREGEKMSWASHLAQ